MSKINELMLKEEAERKASMMSAEEIKILSNALNHMAQTEFGEIVLKRLVKVCRMFAEPANLSNAYDLAKDRILQSVWLAFRSLLTPENREKIERG